MGIKIGHASIDENGNISGGKTGDQTAKEICIRPWYNKPWNVYLECNDLEISDKAADFMERICFDPNYGYDQMERLTGYNAIIKNNNNVIGAKGEFDCSSLISSCYKLAGLDVSFANTTRSIRQNFLATRKFKVYTDTKHLISDIYAKRGGIYLSEGHHVVMALENGTGIMKNPYTEPSRIISNGCEGNDVKWVQWELCEAGIEVVIDGSFRSRTEAAIIKYQQSCKIEVDGKVGTITRKCLKSN